MATANQTARDKFLEARKAGVDAVTARKQAYGEVAPAPTGGVVQAQPIAPVAGVAPAVAPAPAPTTPVTPAPVGTTTPSGATLTPEGNIVQPTTTAPTTPAPTPVPEPVVAKTATPTENITQSDFQKAQAESEKIKAQNEAQMTLNQQNADIKDKERQKIAEEQKIASTPTDMQGILSSMVAGVPVAPQKSGNYINAKFQYDQFGKFNAMTPTQLLDNLKQGQIGTDMDKLLSQNPNYVQAKAELDKIQKTNSINNNIRTIYGGVTGAESETPDYLTQASDALIAKLGLDQDQTSAEAFAEYVTGDQKIVDYTNQLSNTNRQIADTAKLINDGIKSLKSQKGDMPADALVVLMNSTFKDVNETLTNLNNTKTYLEADLKNATEMAKNRYDAVSKDIENSRTIKNSVISNLIQSQFSLAQKQTEADIAKKIAQEALNDPYTAIPAMIEEYKKLGIPFTRSTQQIIQDFEASGKDIATYLTELQGQIQSKPEYQAYQDKQTGTEWQSTSITRYNPATGANESTPIFYRKKTNGEFEAVDLAGNKLDSSVLTGGGVGAPGTLPGSFTGDTTSYIASKEGFRDKAYQDSAGVWTIGYGTTRINGKPIQPGQTITQADAQNLLTEDIAKHSTWKTLIDPNTLSPSQQTALASFEYNLGPGIWNKSAMNIISMIKSGDLAGAGKEMQKYNQAGGKVIPGLQNRRAEEAQLLQSTGASTTTPTQEYSPDKIKSFEAFNGTTFPADYKTPQQQKEYRDEYNAWIASRPGTKIETGNDLINIKLNNPTEGQSASLAFGARMIDAAKNAQQYEDIFNKLPLAQQVYQAKAPELLSSQNQKSLMREKMDFITAVLRKESGAAISPSEFEGQDKIFFPQPGDGPEVLLAKRNARNFRVKAMLATAGVDTEGNSVSKYYNPPILTADQVAPEQTDKISNLKKTYFN